MKKIIATAFAALSATFLITPIAANAQAPTKVVSNGIKISFGAANPSQYCTLGPVGFDAQGNNVGITAAHCLSAPDDWRGVELPEDRAAQATVWDANDPGHGPIGNINFVSANQRTADYLVIDFNDTVSLSSNGPHLRVDSIAPCDQPFVNPFHPAGYIATSGQTTGLTPGIVTARPEGMIRSWAVKWRGDSGGPIVVNGTTKWAGITSRIELNVTGPWTDTSACNILNDLNSRNVTGTGFAPVNN